MTDAPNTHTLHLLNKAPEHSRFARCLQSLQPGDSLVLMENAVLALANSGLSLPEPCYALQADVRARGLSTQNGRHTLIDYQELVQLTADNPRIISW